MEHSDEFEDMPNITANFSNDAYEHRESTSERLFLELFTVIGVLSVVANTLLIFVTFKYKRMKKEPTNIIFMHVNALQAVYFFATPLTLRVGMTLLEMTSVHMVAFCVSYQIETVLLFATTWFLFLLVCDWFLKLYYKETYKKFCRVYKFILIGLYVVALCCGSVAVQLCFKRFMMLMLYVVMMLCNALLIIVLIVINIVHAFKKRRVVTSTRKGYFGLATANIYVLCWCPIFLFLIINTMYFIYAPIVTILLCVIGFCSPIVNAIYLYFYDDDFNVFLRQVLTCRCNEYKNENLDDRSVIYNDVNGVEIPENC